MKEISPEEKNKNNKDPSERQHFKNDIIRENNDNQNNQDTHLNSEDITLNVKNKKVNLPENLVTELENPNLCEICFCSDVTKDTAVKFHCNHIFCLVCVKTYLEKNIENGKV